MTAPTTRPTAAFPVTSRLGTLSQQVHAQPAPAGPLAAPAVSADVLSTTDYTLFRPIDSNRPLVEAHVRNLMEQITEKNLLHLRPLDVNATMGVVDGQHRLEAARRLGLRVYYRVGQLDDDDMASLNRVSRTWKNTDYLHYWASKGQPNYLTLVGFLEQYPHFILSAAQHLLSPESAGDAAGFREGRYQVESEARAKTVAAFLGDVTEQARFKYAYDVRFVAAVMRCFTHVRGFEAATMLRKLLLQPTELVRCATLPQYLDLFERLYNYKTTEKLQVRFR